MPVYGDQVVGYISKANGITIHRKTCNNVCNTNERIIKVDWDKSNNKKYITNILVYTTKKDDILSDIIVKTTSLGISVKSVNTVSGNDYNLYDLNILVADKDTLDKYITILNQLADVKSVERGNS